MERTEQTDTHADEKAGRQAGRQRRRTSFQRPLLHPPLPDYDVPLSTAAKKCRFPSESLEVRKQMEEEERGRAFALTQTNEMDGMDG